MIRMRVILLMVALAFVYGQYWIFTTPMGIFLQISFHALDAAFLLAAAGILFFSFFQIDITPQGELCYNPNNFWWKAMSEFWDGVWKDKNSLCKAYWLTFFLICIWLIAFAIIAAVLALVIAFPPMTISEKLDIGIIDAIWIELKWIGISLVSITGAVGLIWAAFRFIPLLKNTWLGQVFRIMKRKFCPTLIACPLPGSEKSVSA